MGRSSSKGKSRIFIVDSNIVFSGILNSSSRIGKILINSKEHFQFFTCDFLKDEISKHRKKIQKRTGLSEFEVIEIEGLITNEITFINEGLIPKKIFSETKTLLEGVALDDTPFVALTKHLKGKLWTGDKELMNGLKKKGFKNFITTAELSLLLDKLEMK